MSAQPATQAVAATVPAAAPPSSDLYPVGGKSLDALQNLDKLPFQPSLFFQPTVGPVPSSGPPVGASLQLGTASVSFSSPLNAGFSSAAGAWQTGAPLPPSGLVPPSSNSVLERLLYSVKSGELAAQAAAVSGRTTQTMPAPQLPTWPATGPVETVMAVPFGSVPTDASSPLLRQGAGSSLVTPLTAIGVPKNKDRLSMLAAAATSLDDPAGQLRSPSTALPPPPPPPPGPPSAQQPVSPLPPVATFSALNSSSYQLPQQKQQQQPAAGAGSSRTRRPRTRPDSPAAVPSSPARRHAQPLAAVPTVRKSPATRTARTARVLAAAAAVEADARGTAPSASQEAPGVRSGPAGSYGLVALPTPLAPLTLTPLQPILAAAAAAAAAVGVPVAADAALPSTGGGGTRGGSKRRAAAVAATFVSTVEREESRPREAPSRRSSSVLPDDEALSRKKKKKGPPGATGPSRRVTTAAQWALIMDLFNRKAVPTRAELQDLMERLNQYQPQRTMKQVRKIFDNLRNRKMRLGLAAGEGGGETGASVVRTESGAEDGAGDGDAMPVASSAPAAQPDGTTASISSGESASVLRGSGTLLEDFASAPTATSDAPVVVESGPVGSSSSL